MANSGSRQLKLDTAKNDRAAKLKLDTANDRAAKLMLDTANDRAAKLKLDTANDRAAKLMLDTANDRAAKLMLDTVNDRAAKLKTEQMQILSVFKKKIMAILCFQSNPLRFCRMPLRTSDFSFTQRVFEYPCMVIALFSSYMAGATWNCCRLGASSVHLTTMHQFTVSLYSKLQTLDAFVFSVSCHLHFWQYDRDLLCATAVTRKWNGYQNKSQHRKLTLEKKILPPLLPVL